MGFSALFKPEIMTAAGGIVVALFAIYVFARVIEKLAGNHINHNTAAIEKLAETLGATGLEQAKQQAASNEIMRGLKDVIERKIA